MKKKYLIIFSILASLMFQAFVNAAETGEDCESKKGYSQYQCRVKQLCEKYDSKKPVWRGDGYQEAETYQGQSQGLEAVALEEVKNIYRTNMGNIYKCALINSQKTTLKTFREKLIKIDKTGKLENTMGRQIDAQLQKIDITASSIGCQNIENTQIYNKLNILGESTLEMCKYVTYLEYLQSYYEELDNLVGNSGQNENIRFNNQEVSQALGGIQGEIQSEIDHSLKIMPMAFRAYSQYENNLPAHLLLQIIKEDYTIIRDMLYRAFSPISQVVYKISNAMQK